MTSQNPFRSRTALAVAALLVCGVAATARYLQAQAASDAQKAQEASFAQVVKPFFDQYCMSCHSSDVGTAGVRVDQLDAKMEDRHVQMWESIRHRVRDGSMPPKGLPQPSSAEQQRMVEWIGKGLTIARLRPAPKNGLVRRLTVSQYRNTLRELLGIDDDLTVGLPPDAVSKDGFLNNKDTLQMSPLLTESYFEIAEEALNRAIVDPKSKPSIQNFRVELGASVNPSPIADRLVLGAGSTLLKNEDVLVTQLTPKKPFAFEPFFMQTKFRFIEGYQGNDTVRGWRDFDSIYHAVFADMRGSGGYPKGEAYSTVPQGLLLRPAIPNDENFDADGTYGPKANFKISLRELPEHGRFRVTVTAAKYNDGLLLDAGAAPRAARPEAVVWRDPKTAANLAIPQAGVYQVDVHADAFGDSATADASRLNEGLALTLPSGGSPPFGKPASFAADSDAVVVPPGEALNVGTGDFTVAAWIRPSQIRRAAIAAFAGGDGKPGWVLSVEGRGSLRFRTTSPDATVFSGPDAIRAEVWQHVAVVAKRGANHARLYVNGYLVGRGTIGTADLDNPAASLTLGQAFRGDIDAFRIYRRTLDPAEIQALVEPGKQFAKPPSRRPDNLALTIGGRQFSGKLQPGFLVLRLEGGPLAVATQYNGLRDLDRIVFTPLPVEDEAARRFLAFEKRLPRVGVHLGFRRDCGSTFAPVGPPQTVSSGQLTTYVFESAIRNFPRAEVEKDNVNYLAGIHEIAVRSEFTDGRDMPRLVIRSVEFEGPLYDAWPPAPHRAIFVDFARKNDPTAYARKVIHDFASRAYRRPVSPAEETALMNVYRNAAASGEDFTQSVKDALLVALTSPQFLFLVETSQTPAPEPLHPYELASKLSYFLWNGPPDRRSLQLATAGTLPKQVDAEVARMIADARFSRFMGEFASQWLSLDKFQVLEPDKKRFPNLTQHMRAQLRQEPGEFLQYLIRNNLPVRNLVQSDIVVANEAVATYYDLGGKTESGFGYVAIPHGRRDLGGLLTQAAILAGLSDGRESNPVKRGAWMARKIIAEPPPDPPPNVPQLKEETKNLTLRQRLEQHRDLPACSQCHARIDPWGVPFEEYDAGGRVKSEPVDAKSKLPDQTEIAGVNDLKRHLAEDRIDQVAFSFLKHLTSYAIGRSLTNNELNFLRQDGKKLQASGYRMQDMVRYVAASKLFLEK
jgi:cytochrome c5